MHDPARDDLSETKRTGVEMFRAISIDVYIFLFLMVIPCLKCYSKYEPEEKTNVGK